jgi:hypothetical protein
MSEFEVGVDANDGFQIHQINADRHRVIDGALTFWRAAESEYVIAAIFAEWSYVIDRTVTRITDATQ